MSGAPWPRDLGAGRAFARFDTPGPVEITKALIWMMRDRGLKSPADMCGVTRCNLELVAKLRRKRPSAYQTFGEALEAAIASGWVESYEVGGETYYLPNYRRAPGQAAQLLTGRNR